MVQIFRFKIFVLAHVFQKFPEVIDTDVGSLLKGDS